MRFILFLIALGVAFAGGMYANTPDAQKAIAALKEQYLPSASGETGSGETSETDGPVTDATIDAQRANLAAATAGSGAGPQSPRDLSTQIGANSRVFGEAPNASSMNLCNIHFHEGAEHKGGEFTTYAGPGNGKGKDTGFLYDGDLSAAELSAVSDVIGDGPYGALEPGDTIEIHYVHSSADITPGPTLGACVSDAIGNPQLRVETVVAVLVNDPTAANMVEISEIGQVNGYHQAVNMPDNLGTPVRYRGSTTGPSFNEKASPFQVSWSVRPSVLKVDITSVAAWLSDNPFDEKYAHGVRNLVVNPDLISSIDQ